MLLTLTLSCTLQTHSTHGNVQVESLFRAALDYLAIELRPGICLSIAVMNGSCDKVQFGLVLYLFSGVTDVQGLAGRLLEVALLRIAKVIICHKSSLTMGRITMGFLTARHLKFKSIRPLFSLSLSGPVRTRAGWHHFQPPWCRTLRRGERRQLWWLR